MLLAENIENMVKHKKKKLPVMICSNTDPYQPMEKQYKITRRCIEILTKYDFPIFIFTKSNMVTRDVDELSRTNTVVAMTVTTINHEKQRKIEPGAPTPNDRLSALKELTNKGVKTIARIDPIIPMLTDDENELRSLVEALAKTGIRHITTATLKPVAGFFPRLKKVDPELHAKLRPLDRSRGERIIRLRPSSGMKSENSVVEMNLWHDVKPIDRSCARGLNLRTHWSCVQSQRSQSKLLFNMNLSSIDRPRIRVR